MSIARDNTKHPHIFIHVPKTGGCSIAALPWVGGNGHLSHRAFLNRKRRDIEKFIVWGCVRDPVARVVSAWRCLRQRPGEDVSDIMQFRDINDWVAWMAGKPHRMYFHAHTTPQVVFLSPLERVWLVPVLEGQNIADSKTFKMVAGMVTGKTWELKTINRTDDDGSLLNNCFVGHVRNMYRDDCELFARAVEMENARKEEQ